jgi:hypothetical protein
MATGAFGGPAAARDPGARHGGGQGLEVAGAHSGRPAGEATPPRPLQTRYRFSPGVRFAPAFAVTAARSRAICSAWLRACAA